MKTDSTSPGVCVHWINDDESPIVLPQIDRGIDATEVLRDAGHWVAQRVEVAGNIKAADGPRLGSRRRWSDRRGSSEDVVAPVLVKPTVALEAVSTSSFFERPLRRVRVDLGSGRDSGSWRTWIATVRTGWFSSRKANLRIGPSASGNLTVIQLVPRQPRHFRTGAFVNVGVEAVDELRDRLLTSG